MNGASFMFLSLVSKVESLIVVVYTTPRMWWFHVRHCVLSKKVFIPLLHHLPQFPLSPCVIPSCYSPFDVSYDCSLSLPVLLRPGGFRVVGDGQLSHAYKR
eukprot:GHVU01131415.1.p1 GENE.GHVU01131415.1~~GHVU01131415.1.p1  ORF type:complete len:101 (-),score=1.05 GHVU01131415.1:414-716(-)